MRPSASQQATATPRIAVVTGASAGVGRAVARRMAAEGWDLALLARGDVGLAGAARDVAAQGQRALTLEVDVADSDAVTAAAMEIREKLGEIDVWVNAAMTTVLAPATEITPQEYSRVTEVCYLGYVYGTRAALQQMLPRDQGIIVQVGSALAYRGIPLQSAYCAAKHAVRGFSDSVRAELRHERSRVRVTEVHLPGLNTPQFSWGRSRLSGRPRPVPPVFDPAVAADAVSLAIARPQRREYWVGGSTVKTILGSWLAPRLVDHYLARAAYSAQQRDEERTNDPDNLDNPVDAGAEGRDFGARGSLAEESHHRSFQMWLSRYRRPLTAGALTAAGAAGLAVLRRCGRGR